MSSVVLPTGVFLILLLDSPATQPPRRSTVPPATKAGSYRGLLTFVLILGWSGRKPLFYILFWQIAIFCGFNVLFLFWCVCDFPFNLLLRHTSWKYCKTTGKTESFTKFSNILSLWNCCHSYLRLSCDLFFKQDAFDPDLPRRWPRPRPKWGPGPWAGYGEPWGAGQGQWDMWVPSGAWHLVTDVFLCSWLSFLSKVTVRDVQDSHLYQGWLTATRPRLSRLYSLKE